MRIHRNKQSLVLELSERLGRSEIWISLVIFAGALVLFSPGWIYDIQRGGVSTLGALRVLEGEVPYRDFWTMYSPGHFYLLALLFKTFGIHLRTEAVAASVFCATAAVVVFWLALRLSRERYPAVLCSGIFVLAVSNTGYFKRLGSYPASIALVFLALTGMLLYYEKLKLQYLIYSGLLIGAVLVIKHDVGVYTLAAVLLGLIAHHLFSRKTVPVQQSLPRRVLLFLGCTFAVSLPPYVVLAFVAGPDMFQDLVVFPATDFRFARPEGYPNLLPIGIYNPSMLQMLNNLLAYISFAIPFGLFLLGLVAIGMSGQRNRWGGVGMGVTFSAAFLLHYSAAHIQINTHIVTMSAYAALLGAILYGVAAESLSRTGKLALRRAGLALAVVWSVALAAKPAYLFLKQLQSSVVELNQPWVSGYRVPWEQEEFVDRLAALVDEEAPGERLFVGLNRHDVVVTGDLMIYVALGRLPASKYHEIHPAVVDTGPIQREMIEELHKRQVPLVITKKIFSDETLERVKSDFLRNLPIGATSLDDYVREQFEVIQNFGPYTVWKRKGSGPHQ